MADLAFAAAGGLPVRVNLPVPLQRPYAADPGTLTEWLVTNTTNLGRDEVLEVLAAMNAKYANVTDPALPQERADALLRELAEDVLASEGLESFLTVTTPEGGLQRLLRSPGCPVSEVEWGRHLPMMGSQRGGRGVRRRGRRVVRRGPDNPRVPIQGDELVSEFADPGAAGANVKVPLLQYVPMAWAPYFMAAQSPEAARRTLRRLTEGNMTDLQRQHTTRLETWMRAACMRSGPIGANRYRSKLHMTWVAHRAVLDRTLGRWATRRLAPFLTAPVVVPPPAAPIIAPPVFGEGAAMLPQMGGGGGFGGPPYEGRETKVYSPLEHERIRLACGLDPANYDVGRPPIYAVFLAEGRSMVKVEAVLQKFLTPGPNDWDPIRVYVSQELVRDMKDLKFGWGNENTHDTCHRGISPFAVLQVSMDQQTKRRKTQERADRATYLSTDDVRALEAEPGCCPGSYHGMTNLLRRYIRLLTVLFGAGCSHLTEVQGVYQVRDCCIRDNVGRTDCRNAVAVFVDARSASATWVRDFQNPSALFAQARPPRMHPSCVHQLSGGAAVEFIVGGGGVAGGQRQRSRQVVAIMQGLRAKRPGVDMNAVMRSEKLGIAEIGIGGKGACLDFMYFGECARAGCSYDHGPARNVSAGKRRDCVKRMTKAAAGYLENNPAG
ncbi:hypothetical protein MHU86_17778 [Fragilaria crotonensis]|nr:hypothetical protein MHU86_17778 [Fragilaria crotonensis]